MSKYIVFIVLCGVIGAMLGKYFGNSCKTKAQYFADFSQFCRHFKQEISYLRPTFTEIFEKYTYASKEFSLDCANFLQSRQNGDNFRSVLSNPDDGIVQNFFAVLGKTDQDTQLAILDTHQVKIDEKADEYRKKAQKNCPLYVKLGLLLGLSVGVLLI